MQHNGYGALCVNPHTEVHKEIKDLFSNSPHAVVNLCYADSMFVSLQLPYITHTCRIYIQYTMTGAGIMYSWRLNEFQGSCPKLMYRMPAITGNHFPVLSVCDSVAVCFDKPKPQYTLQW